MDDLAKQRVIRLGRAINQNLNEILSVILSTSPWFIYLLTNNLNHALLVSISVFLFALLNFKIEIIQNTTVEEDCEDG